MKLVVDANVLFAVVIKQGKTTELIFSDNFELFAPEFIFEELEKHRDMLVAKSRRTSEEFDTFISIMAGRIKIVSADEFSSFMNKAKSVCPDPNDVQYFALALKLDCAIWSNEKLLKKQSKIKVFSTSDLIKELGLKQ